MQGVQHVYAKVLVITCTKSRYSNARDSLDGPSGGEEEGEEEEEVEEEEEEEEEEKEVGFGLWPRAKRAGSSSNPSALMIPSAPVVRRLSTTSSIE